ncbi:receptor-like protein kinase THESEUS 1 [Durio zibethinus]|uniref:Receptor-like protein kinase THESEUS 1 n=1 Tax=Durio zibethinus TaxID=66656 RepID=A0A6P6AI31_DURZI|nr:receptor-like protein kinase THESEUS 1 [Durio zibethinus]
MESEEMKVSFKLLLIFFPFVFFVHPIICSTYSPVDVFLINCGGSNPIEVDDSRVFQPDSSIPHVKMSPSSEIVVSDDEMSSSGNSALYNFARVFEKTSAYAIRTKQIGRHWLRLHFFPVQDTKYDLKSAVFSVTANGITLLHQFSFLKMGQNSPLVKEYAIEIGSSSSKKLELTFSPRNGSLAFINGIEVVAVPNKNFPSSLVPIPLGPEVEISKHVAFETAYRINMGGPLLTPKNDSMWRIWEPDQPYLVNAASARNVMVNPNLIMYPDGISAEIAPNWVYATAQEMAEANVTDQKFNISWTFEVEEGFTYLIRLHFCDIVSVALNSLVFNVYINKQSALTSFDISSRTKALSAAYYVDFLVNVSMGSTQILIQIGPPDLRNLPSNAILNGLEILKMSNPCDSLDGNVCEINKNSKIPSRKLIVLAICSAAVFTVVTVILAIFFLHLRQPKKPKRCSSTWFPLPKNVGNSDSKVSICSLASTAQSHGLGRILSFSEIREATKNFDESLVIGVGGFGKVYKGMLENGFMVAVKRGNPGSRQGLTEFRTEILMLSKLRHRHLVSLIGYCEEQNEMILVYEFMAGGPLRRHLYGSNLPPLSWKQRLEICIGAAKGLHYLHTGAAETIIHRDVKTTNILLDENFTAKVADFGLSKLGPTVDQTHVSTAVKGSFGYLDPEYFRRQQLTEKSDVYSFGVVLMEILCARPAINPALPREQVNIAEWAMHWQKKGLLERIIDPHLVGFINLESLRKFSETAEKCLAEHGAERPTMGDVLWNLEYGLELQEASIQHTASSENSANHIPDIPGWIPQVESINANHFDCISDQATDTTTTTSDVFSELMDPKGR